MARIALNTEARIGAMAMLTAYRATAPTRLAQTYRARPSQIKPPSAFVDTVRENTDAFTVRESQRTVRVGIRFVWGIYDAGPTVDARDEVVDGFYAYVADNGDHAFGANTVCSWVSVEDDEDWSPAWIPTDESSYFSTLITLEGFAST